MIEVAKELIESMHRGQKLIAVAKMIFAKLSSGIAKRFQQLSYRRVLGLQTNGRAWNPDFTKAGAIDALACDERGASRRAALLAIAVGKHQPLLGEPINVWGLVTHHPVAVTT